MADDEPARSELADQRGDRRQAEIHPYPRRVGVQFKDDQRREHGRQHSADRAAGLLQEHRHDGDQHFGQVARFPWDEPFQPNGLVASTPANVTQTVGGSPTCGGRWNQPAHVAMADGLASSREVGSAITIVAGKPPARGAVPQVSSWPRAATICCRSSRLQSRASLEPT